MNEETPEVLGPIVECILEREGIQGRLQVKKKNSIVEYPGFMLISPTTHFSSL
jgi:hypothetical protein